MRTFARGKTIRQLCIDTTRKFVVVKWDDDFKKGEILTFVKDDNAEAPWFRNEKWIVALMSLDCIAYYEDQVKEGDRIYVSDWSAEDALEEERERILLRKCNNGYVCIQHGLEEDYLEWKTFETVTWKYAVSIPEKKTKTITIQVTEEQEEEINNIINK